MKLELSVTKGPHLGKQYTFDRHDTFLVGRAEDAHFKLSYDDPYFSRRHFVVEINPPRCRVLDLKSRNGTVVNGTRIDSAELTNGDEIAAGNTVFKVTIVGQLAAEQLTLDLIASKKNDPEPTLDLPSKEFPALPGYKLVSELGRGGMGVVYKATQLSTGNDIAVKMITPAAGVSQKQIARFIRECQILSQLAHPNIVAFHEVGEVDGVVFLAMEFVNGLDLARAVDRRGPLSIRVAVRMMCQILAGLGQAHARGFVHRDIKPANILVAGEKGQRTAKLADFGLARVYEASQMSGLTMQGETGGTPAYMAPEQVTHYRDVKPAADQYSAAATLYKLISGHSPHNLPKNAAAQLIHLVSEQPVPIQTRRSAIPSSLAGIIHRALSREPESRFSSVVEFRRSLLAFDAKSASSG